jgi:hypothetical protein
MEPYVYYNIPKSPQEAHVGNCINPVNILSCLFKIQLNITLLRTPTEISQVACPIHFRDIILEKHHDSLISYSILLTIQDFLTILKSYIA